MALLNASHNKQAQLSGGITNSAGTLTVNSAAGFPTPPFGIVVDGFTVNEEVMVVNSWSGTGNVTWSVSRAQDGTGATPGSVGYAHADLAIVENDVTATYITNINTQATGHAHTGADQSTTIFDSTAPTTDPFGGVASAGSTTIAAHRDHIHGLYSPYYSAHPNGGFESWQLGTTVTSPVNTTYIGPDLWQWTTVGTGIVTVTQSTDVPTVAQTGNGIPYSMLITPTTADTSIAAGDLYAAYSNLEGWLTAHLLNGFAVSFWVKAHLTGQYTFSVFDGTASRNFVVPYTVNSADTWEYKTAVIPTTVGSGGTFSITTGRGMGFIFALSTGTSWMRTADGAWGTGSLYGATGQVNMMGATANTIRIWGLNIVPGSQPTPYIPPPFPLQMERLRRYINVYGDAGTQSMVASGQAFLTTAAYFYIPLPTPMMGTPALTVSAASDFNVLSAAGGGISCTALALTAGIFQSYHGITLQATVASGLVAGNISHLYCQNANSRLRLEAYP